jgi:hypothetical protein
VAEGVGDSTHTPAVVLAHRSDFGSTRPHRLIEHGVGIIDDKQRPARRATYRSGAEALHVRTRLGNPELGRPDRQLSHNVVPLANAVKHDGVERRLIEGDGCARALYP